MKRDLVCIICPRGCNLTVDITENCSCVSGNACKKGEEYGILECTNPLRTVTSIIKVQNRPDTMVSVKTSTPVKKADIFKALKEIKSVSLEAPIKIGDILIKDVCGADIIATKEIK